VKKSLRQEPGEQPMKDIPFYVRNALENWETLAFVAYDWYEKHGRIVVAIEEDPDDPQGARLLGVTYDFNSGKPDPRTVQLLVEYDPATEILIQFLDEAKHVRTQRLRTAPGGQHPKKVFFFEMLRRVNDEPGKIDPEDLPEWFIDALQKLEAARKAKESGSASY
jgi:hypothetical protein